MENLQELINKTYKDLNTENLYPRSNGWAVLNSDSKLNNDVDLFDIKTEICTDIRPNDSIRSIVRPVSLRGIETNNGWIPIKEFKGEPQYVKGWNSKKEMVFLIMVHSGEVLEDNADDYKVFQYIDLDIPGPVYLPL